MGSTGQDLDGKMRCECCGREKEKCQYCGRDDETVKYIVDPYTLELDDEEVYKWMCHDCAQERHDAI